jgi:uncharacterized peroxidase-related enzyme
MEATADQQTIGQAPASARGLEEEKNMTAHDERGAQAAPTRLSWLALEQPEIGPEVQAVLDRTRERIGYVRPGQYLGAHKPASLVAQEKLSATLMADEGISLSPLERELIALVVSVENRCAPCIFGHAAQLRRISGDPVSVALVEANYRQAGLAPRQRAIADFAVKVTRTPGDMEESDLEPLRAAGLTELEILEAAGIIAYFNLSNRLNSALGIAAHPAGYLAHR